MRKILSSQLMYIKFDFKNRYLMHTISYIAFIGIYIYFIFQKREFINRTAVDNLMLSNYLLFYIIARIVLSGISIPYEVLNTEYTNNNLIMKQSIIGYNIELLLSTRIFLMVVKSFLFNILTFILIVSTGGFVLDIMNYIVLMIPVFIGTLHIAFIGYFVSSILLYLNIKREFISIVQAALIVVFLTLFREDNYFYPFSIIRNQISGILSSDLIFAELGISQALSLIWYWVIIFATSILLIFATSYLVNIFFHKKIYKTKSSIVSNT